MAVAAGILQQVAQGAAHQLGNRRHLQSLCGLHVQVGIHARAFLGGQPDQVHRFGAAHVHLGRLQPAGQQDLVHQLVQLGDVALDLGLGSRHRGAVAAHQLQPHADARQRRAQLVRGIRQQRFVRLHQGLDAAGRSVELARQVGHLVAPLGGHAHAQVAFAETLHAALQVLQPLEQAPDDGEHAHHHHQADQAQQPQEAKRRPQPEGPVLAAMPWGRAAAPGAFARIAATGLGPRGHLQVVGLTVRALDVEHHAVRAGAADALERALQQDLALPVPDHQLARVVGLLGVVAGVVFLRHAPGPADHQGQHGHAAHHRQPDAQVQPLGKDLEHARLSPAAWRRHSPRRAPSGCAWGPWGRPRWPRGCGPCARRWSGRRPPARGRARPP